MNQNLIRGKKLAIELDNIFISNMLVDQDVP